MVTLNCGSTYSLQLRLNNWINNLNNLILTSKFISLQLFPYTVFCVCCSMHIFRLNRFLQNATLRHLKTYSSQIERSEMFPNLQSWCFQQHGLLTCSIYSNLQFRFIQKFNSTFIYFFNYCQYI